MFPGCFANGLPAREGAALAAEQQPPVASILSDTLTTAPAWQTIPSWDVIGTADHVIPPAEQVVMAKRAGSHITEIKAPHLSMISDPGAVTSGHPQRRPHGRLNHPLHLLQEEHMTAPSVPVVFIHGLWIHSTAWQPWVELFRSAGYDATAPGWPGDSDSVEQTRKNAAAVAGKGIDDITNGYLEVISGLPAKPIVIGHSFGGLIAQKLLSGGRGRSGDRDRPRPDQGGQAAAVRPDPFGAPGAVQAR